MFAAQFANKCGVIVRARHGHMGGRDAAERQRTLAGEALHCPVELPDEADRLVFRTLQQAGDQPILRPGNVGETLERAFAGPLKRDVGGVGGAGLRRQGQARKARAIAGARDGAAEGIARLNAEHQLFKAQCFDIQFIEADANVGSGTTAFLHSHGRRAEDIDDAHADLADFELADKQGGGRPFDADIARTQPYTLVIDQCDIGECCRVQRIALEARDTNGAEGPELAAIDLRGDESAARVAGDPEAQHDSGREQQQHQTHQPEADGQPERRLLLRPFALGLCSLGVVHQKACPMEM